MPTTLTKFIVVSLPRTGTRSLLQMAKRMGLEISHAPGPAFEEMLERVDIIADTPAFRPSVFNRMVVTEPEIKFIYITKSSSAWVESMNKVGLCDNYNGMYERFTTEPETLSEHNMADLDSLREILGAEFDNTTASVAFEKHAQAVKRLIPTVRLLVYNFSDGWKPLADFLGTEVPNEEIPHLNRDTMFDKFTD